MGWVNGMRWRSISLIDAGIRKRVFSKHYQAKFEDRQAASFRRPGLARTFEAAARHLNFSRAADELGLTPAAVSYQIKDIEAQLGLALFARTSRSIRLTPAGEALAGAAADALDGLRARHRRGAAAGARPGRCACQWARALPRTGCCRVCRAFAPRIRNGS